MAKKRKFQMIQKFMPIILVLALFLGFSIFFFYFKQQANKPEEQEQKIISVVSNVPGYDLKINNRARLDQFLNDNGFWEYDSWPFLQPLEEVKELKMVFTNEILPMYQTADQDKKIFTSFDIRPEEGKIFSIHVYVNPDSVATQEEKDRAFEESLANAIFLTYRHSYISEQEFYKDFYKEPSIFKLEKINI